jgi:hypothetical protein
VTDWHPSTLSNAVVHTNTTTITYSAVGSSTTSIKRSNILLPKNILLASAQPHLTLEPYTVPSAGGPTFGTGVKLIAGDLWSQHKTSLGTSSLYYFDGADIIDLGSGSSGTTTTLAASAITAGTFGVGNYVFPNTLTISGDVSCSSPNALWVNQGLYVNTGQINIPGGLIRDSVVVGSQAYYNASGSVGGGCIDVETNIFKRHNSAYNNPDFVFEHFYTGQIVKFAKNERADGYTGLMPLDELREYTKEHLRLPDIKDEPTGIFTMANISLEKIEQLYLYIFQQEDRIKELEKRLLLLESKT